MKRLINYENVLMKMKVNEKKADAIIKICCFRTRWKSFRRFSVDPFDEIFRCEKYVIRL